MRRPWPRLYVRIFIHGATVLVTALVVYSICCSRCDSSETDRRPASRTGADRLVVDSQLGDKDNVQLLAKLNRPYLLAIFIVSSPANRANRNLLRNTWLRLRDDVFHVFVVGGKRLQAELKNEVAKEQLYHHDLLVLKDVEDGYERLTEKVLASLVWISQNVEAKYVMKVPIDIDSKLFSAVQIIWIFLAR